MPMDFNNFMLKSEGYLMIPPKLNDTSVQTSQGIIVESIYIQF